MFSGYWSVYCRYRFYEHQCHRSPARVALPVSPRRGKLTATTVTGSFNEQLVSFRILYGTSCFEMYNVFCFVQELNELVGQLGRRDVSSAKRANTTTDASDDESTESPRWRRILRKKTFKMKNTYAANKLGHFFVTGPTDAAGKPNQFYCQVCWEHVCVHTHGPYEILWHFQGARHFPRDQSLRLESPGWWVMDFKGNPLSDDELFPQCEKLLMTLRVKRRRERVFTEDLLVDQSGAADTNLPVLARVSSLM